MGLVGSPLPKLVLVIDGFPQEQFVKYYDQYTNIWQSGRGDTRCKAHRDTFVPAGQATCQDIIRETVSRFKKAPQALRPEPLTNANCTAGFTPRILPRPTPTTMDLWTKMNFWLSRRNGSRLPISTVTERLTQTTWCPSIGVGTSEGPVRPRRRAAR
jgi:hypothetical protein